MTSDRPISSAMQLAIIGLGNQAKAWAQNWRDSGHEVSIYLRAGSPSFAWARENHFRAHPLKDIHSFSGRIIALLIPDHEQLATLEELQKLGMPQGTTIIYAHGLCMHRYQLSIRFPQWEHWLLAPKAIASQLRLQYQQKGPLAAFTHVANAKNPQTSMQLLNALARDLGINCGPYHADFSQETLADMFSEQAVLCSTLPYVGRYAYELLVKKGIPPELAFYECFYEMKLIIDTMLQSGPEQFFQMISPNAFLGGQQATKILFDDHFHVALEKLWKDLESGQSLLAIDREMNHLRELRSRESRQWNEAVGTQFKRFKEATDEQAGSNQRSMDDA